MHCPRCSTPTVYVASFGNTQCRRCPLCAALVKGPR